MVATMTRRGHSNRVPPGCSLNALAVNLKRERIFRGLTQRQLANMAGISLTTVQHIESQKVIPHASTVALLAEVFAYTNTSTLWGDNGTA